MDEGEAVSWEIVIEWVVGVEGHIEVQWVDQRMAKSRTGTPRRRRQL